MHPDWQDKIHLYAEDHSSPEPAHLQKVTEFTWKKMINPRQLSGHLQGRFLANLIILKNPKCVLEIGSFTGYSTACLAENLSAEAHIHSIEADSETAYKTQQFWKEYPIMERVAWHIGPALDIIPTLNIKPDFIFVDADKRNYKNYLDLCLPLMPKGGLILFDNTLWSGKIIDENHQKNDADTKNMHEFNKYLGQKTNVSTVLLPLRDGLTMSIKL